MNSDFSPLLAILWFGVALAVAITGWRRGNFVLVAVGVLMIAIGAWNTGVYLTGRRR